MPEATYPIIGTGTHRILVQSAASGNTEPGGKPGPVSGKALPETSEKADLEAVVEKLNLASQSIGRDLHFEVNLDSGRSVILVMDRETGEVIREIPPEKVTPCLEANGSLLLRLFDEVI